MATNKDNCGITSILPSCRGRAEDFARRLHARLRSLGSQDETSPANETTWLYDSSIKPLTISQPKYNENETNCLPESQQEILINERLGSGETESSFDSKTNSEVAPINIGNDQHCIEKYQNDIEPQIDRSPAQNSLDTEVFREVQNESSHTCLELSHIFNDPVDIIQIQNCCNDFIKNDSTSTLENTFIGSNNESKLLFCENRGTDSHFKEIPFDSSQILKVSLSDLEMDNLNVKYLNDFSKDNNGSNMDLPIKSSKNDDNKNDLEINSIGDIFCQKLDDVIETGINETPVVVEDLNNAVLTDVKNDVTVTIRLKHTTEHKNGLRKPNEINDPKGNIKSIEEITGQIIGLTANIFAEDDTTPAFIKTAIINEDLDALEDKLDVLHETPVYANSATINDYLDEAQQIVGYSGDNRLFAEQLTDEIITNALNNVNIRSYPNIFSVTDYTMDNDAKKISECDYNFSDIKMNHKGFLSVEDTFEDDDDDDEENRMPRVRRCSSLKTGKTPPGTPCRKKIVRFADVLGLDLADVRTYLDEIPKVPNSAYSDLPYANFDNQCTLISHMNKNQRTLLALFQQPGALANFLYKVKINQVMLENAIFDDPVAFSIKGIVRVRNLDFNKTVHIRYSWDSWKTFSDLQAVYIEKSCDGFSDKFSFLLYAHQLLIGQRIEFAVRFQCRGTQYWDNNGGVNYCFQCLPVSNPTPYAPITGMNDQSASFYYLDDNAEEQLKPSYEEGELNQKAVQDYITQSLQKQHPNHQPKETPSTSKSEFLTIFVILFISVVFLYVKKFTFLF